MEKRQLARNGAPSVKSVATRQLILPENRVTASSDAVYAPEIRSSPGPISQLGGVGDTAVSLPYAAPFPDVVGFTLDNSGGAAAVNYMLFDPLGMVAALLGGVYVDPDGTTAPSYASLKQAVINQPITFKGFNYNVTTGSAAQFSQAFSYARAGIDASVMSKKIFIQTAQRNTQQNDRLLTLNQLIPVDQNSGLVVTVAAATVVELTFIVKDQYNAR